MRLEKGCSTAPGFKETKTDAPKYKLGKDYTEWCQVCKFYNDKTSFCNRYRFKAEPDYTCDGFIPEDNILNFNEKLSKAKKEFPSNPSGTKHIDKAFGIELKRTFGEARNRLLGNLNIHKEKYNKMILTEATIGRSFFNLLIGVMASLNPKIQKILEKYIRKAMEKGFKDAIISARIKGVAPPAKEEIKKHVLKTMHRIKGFTHGMEEDLKELVTEGISQGDSISTVANEIRNKFKITRSRSNTIARSEVVRTYNISKIDTLKNKGFKYGKIIASMDDRTCRGNNFDAYNKLTGETYHNCREWRNKKILLSNPLIPVVDSHPNCRCSVVLLKEELTGEIK